MFGFPDTCKTPLDSPQLDKIQLGVIVPQSDQEGRVLRLMSKGYSRQGAEEQEENKPVSVANDRIRQLTRTSRESHVTMRNIFGNLRA